ncbi:MAG TPA: 4a-hydroxytetrahydrobiopterin dehydratase [Acidimicrobiales bacterium]|nr:4a-hydroxytetrahydrobiopterin dehydratase [Acidimicrobiales bacterium]
MADVLTDEQIDKALAALPGWSRRQGALHHDVRFKDFNEAFGFMTRVALVAERLDHHPDWSNSWNTVSIDIVNHAAGGVTQRCLDLALAIDGLYRVTHESEITTT